MGNTLRDLTPGQAMQLSNAIDSYLDCIRDAKEFHRQATQILAESNIVITQPEPVIANGQPCTITYNPDRRPTLQIDTTDTILDLTDAYNFKQTPEKEQ